MNKRIVPLLYTALLVFALLQPFDFDFGTNHAQWLGYENGIRFKKKGMIISHEAPAGLYRKLTQGGGLALEVWVKSDDRMQDGPARILSYSIDNQSRNFTLAQSRDRLVMRLRTVETDPNGLSPYMEVPLVFTESQKTHIVVTYDFKEQCVFIDGALRHCDGIPKGDFANWDPDCRLVFGNEVTADRPWNGEIYYAAIYDQALGGGEIAEKYDGGIPMGGCLTTNGSAAHTPPLICFPFDEKKGAWVIGYRDGVQAVRLHMPARFPMATNMLQSSQPGEIIQSLGSIYNFLHILLFIPAGAFLYRYVGARVKSAFLTAAIVLIFGSVVSFGFEMVQHFLPSRSSTIIDVAANLMGVCLGIAIAGFRMQRGHGGQVEG